MAKPLICRNLSKNFGSFNALNHINLEIQPGEIFALLGPNGAGKTTLIGCVTGLVRPTKGSVEVFGHNVVDSYRTTRRLVGLVPQEISFDPFFTPYQALMIHMGLMGVKPDKNRAESLLETFSLSSKRDAPTRSLSGGMKRRLLVAKALVHQPKLLFLDEPTAGVDVQLRKDLWRKVKELRNNGTTIILTTHYLEEAEQLADRVGVIEHGQLKVIEKTKELMKRYAHSSVILQLKNPQQDVPDGLPQGTYMTSIQRSEHNLVIPWEHPIELADVIQKVQAQNEIINCEVRQTSLEEIFVSLVKPAGDRN